MECKSCGEIHSQAHFCVQKLVALAKNRSKRRKVVKPFSSLNVKAAPFKKFFMKRKIKKEPPLQSTPNSSQETPMVDLTVSMSPIQHQDVQETVGDDNLSLGDTTGSFLKNGLEAGIVGHTGLKVKNEENFKNLAWRKKSLRNESEK